MANARAIDYSDSGWRNVLLFFRSVCSWVKDQMARAAGAGFRIVGAASDATTTISSGALKDALI